MPRRTEAHRQPIPRESDVSTAVADCKKSGYLAKRPYQLGQGCDGSIDSCVHALLYRWCHDTGHDAAELYRQAYQEHDADNFEPLTPEGMYGTVLFADWQGTAYPERWGDKEFDGLLDSLTAINNHSLRNVVEETAERSKR